MAERVSLQKEVGKMADGKRVRVLNFHHAYNNTHVQLIVLKLGYHEFADKDALMTNGPS